jgi:hypothetical protein
VSLGLSLAAVLRLAVAWAQVDPLAPPPPPRDPLAPPPPPGSQQPQVPAPTRATFVSTTSEQWDVLVDNQPMCATPCTGPLFPLQFVVMRSQESRPVLLEVGRLPAGNLIVSGKPLQEGMYAGGIVATTLGGMAMVVGITFTAVGLAKDRPGYTTAGLITGGAGTVAVLGGIYLMLKAVPSVSIRPAAPGLAAAVGGTF